MGTADAASRSHRCFSMIMTSTVLIARPGASRRRDEWSSLALEGWPVAGWVEPGGSLGVVGDGDGPAAFVDDVVVPEADEVEVFLVGAAAVGDVDAVMGFGPGGGPVASGEDASAVAGDEVGA